MLKRLHIVLTLLHDIYEISVSTSGVKLLLVLLFLINLHIIRP